MKMNYSTEVAQHMGVVLSRFGFTLEEASDSITYGDRPAGAVFYRSADCKLQICWSARDGGLDIMLARLDAPNEFGLANKSKKWHFLLMLDESEDGLVTPAVGASSEELWAWRNALLEAHFSAAHANLLAA
ncbi:hypothetical protein HNP40_002104 [Mycobacteroides chelonae]|nr:hypothetical protein [Mycobacteroides chelonae]